MNRAILNFLSAAALTVSVAVTSASAATTPAQFRAQAVITGDTDSDAPARVTLSAGIISRTHNRFADLRLFDDADREVPFVIHTKTLRGEDRQVARLEPVKYEPLAGGAERLTFRRPASWTAIDGMRVIVSGVDYEKVILVETSDDLKTWALLTNSAIFDYTSRVNLRDNLLTSKPTAAQFIRLTVSGEKNNSPATAAAADEVTFKYKDLEFRQTTARAADRQPDKTKPAVRVNAIEAWHGQTVQERQVLETVPLTVSASATDRDGNTVLELDANLPLTEIQLDPVNYFSRQVQVETISGTAAQWQSVTTRTLYRIPTAAEEIMTVSGRRTATGNFKISSNTAIPLDGIQRQRLRLVIINRDNPPLTASELTGKFPRYDLYFIPEKNRRYTLRFDAADVTRPNYDLPSVLPETSPLLDTAPALTISTIEPNPTFDQKSKSAVVDPEQQTLRQVWLFRAIVLFFAIALALWALSALKKVK